jgi:Fur family ferric uptake transcriptional regulator
LPPAPRLGYTLGHAEPESGMADTILERCAARGLRMTEQRRTIAAVLSESDDHPDVEELHRRSSARDPNISLATVYRTVKLLEEQGILDRLEFGDGRARYEDADRDHHDHLIDMNSGDVIEFVDREIEALQRRVAERLGYELIGHKLELYGKKLPTGRQPEAGAPPPPRQRKDTA